jgi:peptidoglycan hydrolase-like protein with peptidoglycan-binding domain
MTPRQARIALSSFVLVGGGVAYNALYMQGDPASTKTAAEAARSSVPRAEAPSPPRARTTPATKRTAQLKPNAAKSSDAPEALPDEAGTETIRAIQRELGQRGYGPIANDGVMRLVTRAAILSYEHDQGLPLTAEATEALLTRLVLGAPGSSTATGAGEVRSPQAEATIKQVQRLLAANGYRPGPADGRMRADTIAAIRSYEQDQGLSVRGRISAEVVGQLQSGSARLKAAEAH